MPGKYAPTYSHTISSTELKNRKYLIRRISIHSDQASLVPFENLCNDMHTHGYELHSFHIVNPNQNTIVNAIYIPLIFVCVFKRLEQEKSEEVSEQ